MRGPRDNVGGALVTSRVFLGMSAVGFAASAVLHLSTFLPWSPPWDDGPALALFAAAFVPLAAMLIRLRRAGAPATTWGRLRIVRWGALVALVPEPVRWLAFGVVSYTLMNLVLSLMLVGGVRGEAVDGKTYLVAATGERQEVPREEYDAHRRVSARLLSGHLLLFYLVPLIYFRFVEPRSRGVDEPGGGARGTG